MLTAGKPSADISIRWSMTAFALKIYLLHFRVYFFSRSCYFYINLILHLQFLTLSPLLHNSSSLALWESLIALTSSLELSRTSE